MRLTHTVALVVVLQLGVAMPSFAGDFGWMHDLSIQASEDLSDYRARLSTRFHIGDAEVEAVLSKVKGHADAYMVLRLGELSRHSVDDVLDVYHDRKGKGWGVMAKHLGIKPGSKEFHALKRGHDLYDDGDTHHGRGKSKGNSKGKGNNGKKKHK